MNCLIIVQQDDKGTWCAEMKKTTSGDGESWSTQVFTPHLNRG